MRFAQLCVLVCLALCPCSGIGMADSGGKESSATFGISPNHVALLPGSRFTFRVTPPGREVIFSCSAGKITADGIYTAPLKPGTCTLTAISKRDDQRFEATIEILPIKVVAAPDRVLLARKATYALLGAANAGGFRWSVGEPNGGSVTPGGIYTAPDQDGTYTVIATSLLDPKASSQIEMVVEERGPSGGGWGHAKPPSAITHGARIDSDILTMDAGRYEPLSAVAYGADSPDGFTWTLEQGPMDPTTGERLGSIDAQGVFTASHPGLYVVKAVVRQDPGLWATAILLVTPSVKSTEKVPSTLEREFNSVNGLQDGRILFAGGRENEIYPASTWILDPMKNAFAELRPLNIPRLGHKVLLLDNGRVLVAQGYGNRNVLGLPGERGMGLLRQGEILDPTTGIWTPLPFLLESANIGAPAMALPGGKALLIGGGKATGETQGQSLLIEPTLGAMLIGPDIGAWSAAARLEDGNLLITGGYAKPSPQKRTLGAPDVLVSSAAKIFEVKTNTFRRAAPMVQPRLFHTATPLADGRVLLVGGVSQGRNVADATVPRKLEPTSSAEIFDPKTGCFVPTGSAKWPRAGHAAILLPTGQVMVMGGWTVMGFEKLNAKTLQPLYLYPMETEIFDPDAGTWRVMDTLGYGVDVPKLLLLQNGSVFTSGRTVFLEMDPKNPGYQKLAPGPSRNKLRVRFGAPEPPEAAECLLPM